jgi:hypothetical protein
MVRMKLWMGHMEAVEIDILKVKLVVNSVIGYGRQKTRKATNNSYVPVLKV